MISMMMSSENAFESGRGSDAVQVPSLEKPGVCISDDEKASVFLNSDSVVSHVEEVSRVSVNVGENACFSAGDVSLLVDFSGSDEARVSKSVDDENEFMVCEIKNGKEKSETVDANRFDELDKEEKLGSGSEEKGKELDEEEKVDSGSEKKGKVDLVPRAVEKGLVDRKSEDYREGDVSDYDSMLSMFDQFAANGRSESVVNRYEVGDMVWGKVKSHPWWPGHIFNEAFASPSVRRTKREGHLLVAFFGDSSYGWFDPAELTFFERNYNSKSNQSTSRTFVKAVEEAVDEVNRRRALGLACRCRSPYSFRATNVDGYFAVDVGDYDAGIYSASQIKKARDGFQPQEMLDFVKKLALKPMEAEFNKISFIQNRATVLAYRKAVFAEFDETYAQAFGAQPAGPGPASTPSEPSRAPLSGRLVIAEALGKGKGAGKPIKSKDRVEKDKYLFKRRDETVESKVHKFIPKKESSSGPPQHADGSVHPGKGTLPGTAGPASHSAASSSPTEVMDQSVSQPVAINDLQEHGQILNTTGGHPSMVADAKLISEVTKMHVASATKRAKLHKRPIEEINSESSRAPKKIKKRRDIDGQIRFDHAQTPGAAGKGGTVRGKVGEKCVQISSVTRENSHRNHQGSNDEEKKSFLPDLGVQLVTGDKNSQLELPQLLDDLRSLALNPFYGAERSCPATIRQMILRFRSLVYQKSLYSLSPTESEPQEAHPGVFPSLASYSDNFPVGNTKDVMAAKPSKPPSRLDDPTKGGRKRSPSDRQEEIAERKKKKLNHLKTLTSEKKGVQKIRDSEGDECREISAKIMAHAPERKAAVKAPEVPRRDGKEMVVKAGTKPQARKPGSEFASEREEPRLKSTNPTMLVMKFAPGAALPSFQELRAKFARFGALDVKKIRVFWTSSTCRVVFWHKKDAVSAAKSVNEGRVFANTTVRSYVRDVTEVEAPDTESAKVQKEDNFVETLEPNDPSVVQHRQAGNLLQSSHLKSCLKKPTDELGITSGGNGSVRGRVKFMLGGEGTSKTIADDGASSHGFDYNTTDKIQMVVPPTTLSSSSNLAAPVYVSQLPIARNNFQRTELASRDVQNFSTSVALAMPMPGSTNIDITQQLITLLTKCKDVVNNVTGALGYVPYHPL